MTSRDIIERIPLCTINAGPRDGKKWVERLKEELRALIAFVKINKENGHDWFHLEMNQGGSRWFGNCWFFYNNIRYEFRLEFDIPVGYPKTNPALCLPELDGKTVKMYRGGKICLTEHFMPLWARNAPKFGIAHALALGLAPWLAAEIPYLVDLGVIRPPVSNIDLNIENDGGIEIEEDCE
eukprot:TRINITY_DN3143_c5_g3_i1.p1 TRINITY_DN3143_c5_g3~~TRINITY_DN3143_c5_g3_i1.p1  ORF type:complete len:191 (+),score=62.42 TRINITY_DN3143_c5_g3_i1:32-574(+)